MPSALVETFGKELKIGEKEIGQYLKEADFDVLSPILPFKKIEPEVCLILILQAENIDPERIIYLGYWIGASDVPSIPTILVGEPKNIPFEIKRSLNVFCVEEGNIKSILKPLVSAFTKAKEALEAASEAKIDTRIRLRDQLIKETLKSMKEQDYNMEEYKERLV